MLSVSLTLKNFHTFDMFVTPVDVAVVKIQINFIVRHIATVLKTGRRTKTKKKFLNQFQSLALRTNKQHMMIYDMTTDHISKNAKYRPSRQSRYDEFTAYRQHKLEEHPFSNPAQGAEHRAKV